MYLVYSSNYGELAWENDPTEIYGLYDSFEKAKNEILKIYNYTINNTDFILDEESNLENLQKDIFDETKNKGIIFWYSNQENWNCYFELFIKKIDIK